MKKMAYNQWKEFGRLNDLFFSFSFYLSILTCAFFFLLGLALTALYMWFKIRNLMWFYNATNNRCRNEIEYVQLNLKGSIEYTQQQQQQKLRKKAKISREKNLLVYWIHWIVERVKKTVCRKSPLKKKEEKKNDRQKKCGGKLSNCENPKHTLTHNHHTNIRLAFLFICSQPPLRF